MNTPQTMPCCLHPTTILCVDDEKECLEKTALNVNDDNVCLRFYRNPKEALQIVQEQKPLQISHEIYNPQRFCRVSVLSTDYRMDGKNGLQLCSEIGKNSIRKIIVSQHLPVKKAVEAVNSGLLRGYVEKNDIDAMQQLQALLRQAVPEFFCQESGNFHDAGQRAGSALQDPAFLAWFLQLSRKHNIVEHYMLDEAGTFLLVDKNKQMLGLCVRSHEQLQQQANQADILGAPNYVVHNVSSCSHMLCSPHLNNQHLSKEMPWERILHPTSKEVIQGQQKYYICCRSDMFDIKTSDVLSFAQYREQNAL
ncbi:MAG: response regulator [Myxococcota bacterium]